MSEKTRMIFGCVRAVIPGLGSRTFEAIITDPPYNIGTPQRVFDALSERRRLVGGDFGVFDNGAITPAEWMPMVLPLLKPGGVVVSFYSARAMHMLMTACDSVEIVQDFHWCKSNPPAPMRSIGFSWGVESGYIFRRKGEKHRPNKDEGVSPNWIVAPLCGGHERFDHPTQKPESVMSWLVRYWTMPGDCILDPFAGTGTTLRVAKDIGRHAIGIENNEDYYKIANKRLQQDSISFIEPRRVADSPPTLWDAEAL